MCVYVRVLKIYVVASKVVVQFFLCGFKSVRFWRVTAVFLGGGDFRCFLRFLGFL